MTVLSAGNGSKSDKIAWKIDVFCRQTLVLVENWVCAYLLDMKLNVEAYIFRTGAPHKMYKSGGTLWI